MCSWAVSWEERGWRRRDNPCGPPSASASASAARHSKGVDLCRNCSVLRHAVRWRRAPVARERLLAPCKEITRGAPPPRWRRRLISRNGGARETCSWPSVAALAGGNFVKRQTSHRNSRHGSEAAVQGAKRRIAMRGRTGGAGAGPHGDDYAAHAHTCTPKLWPTRPEIWTYGLEPQSRQVAAQPMVPSTLDCPLPGRAGDSAKSSETHTHTHARTHARTCTKCVHGLRQWRTSQSWALASADGPCKAQPRHARSWRLVDMCRRVPRALPACHRLVPASEQPPPPGWVTRAAAIAVRSARGAVVRFPLGHESSFR